MSQKSIKKKQQIPEGYPENWSELRKNARKEANYCCRYCLERGLTLHTHHMYHGSKIKCNDPRNLVCICARCHSILHPRNSKLETGYKQELSNKFELFSKYSLVFDYVSTTEYASNSVENDESFHIYEDNILVKL